MCQIQKPVRELDQSKQLSTKRGQFGPVGKNQSQAALEGLRSMWGGGTFQGVFQVYKEHVPEAKQSSDPPETSGQKKPPAKQIYVATQKMYPHPQNHAGNRAYGQVICAMPRDTDEHSYSGSRPLS